MTPDSAELPGSRCAECGYPLGADPSGTPSNTPCPECGWREGTPISARRRSVAALFYYACFLPIVQLVAIASWWIQHLIVPQGSRQPLVTAIGISVVCVFASVVLGRVVGTSDSAFARLRWISFSAALVIGTGLGALGIVRPGGHAVLLFTLSLFNAGLAYIALVSGGVSMGALNPRTGSEIISDSDRNQGPGDK